jgi:hypothetical protein
MSAGTKAPPRIAAATRRWSAPASVHLGQGIPPTSKFIGELYLNRHSNIMMFV